MPADDLAPLRVLIVFARSDGPARRHWWISNHHCFAIHRSAADKWVGTEWLNGRLRLRSFYGVSAEHLLDSLVYDGHIVLGLKKPGRTEIQIPRLRLVNCVEIVKQSIGLSGFFPITPEGLFRRLAADGARIFINR